MILETDMLFQEYSIGVQPGQVPLVLRLQEGMSTLNVTLHLELVEEEAEAVLEMQTRGICVLRAVLPDKTILFDADYISEGDISEKEIIININGSRIGNLTEIPGEFELQLSVIDFDDIQQIDEDTYENYPLITVQHIWVNVEETAFGHKNLDKSYKNTIDKFLVGG